MTTRFATSRLGMARPGRRAVVIDDLTELNGPVSGTVELPHRLFWYPDRRFDLNDASRLQWMYQVVLREAATKEELRTWLDGATLMRLWPSLHLPRGLREIWELRHPTLSANIINHAG